jgi:hypothetical protein
VRGRVFDVAATNAGYAPLRAEEVVVVVSVVATLFMRLKLEAAP